jgi:hypothetical protein
MEEHEEYEEYELKKKAIFDSMAQRGRERILRIGYENWEPFPMPKDPRERMFGGVSQKARALVREFFDTREGLEQSQSIQRELVELVRGVLQDDGRSKTIVHFSHWLQEKLKGEPTDD